MRLVYLLLLTLLFPTSVLHSLTEQCPMMLPAEK